MEEQFNLGTSAYGFSAVGVENLGATEYTLVTLAVDKSGSVAGFRKEMEACIKEIAEACRKSPRADNLLLRVLIFDDSLVETHGFKLLSDINPTDYDGILRSGGMTALSDATVNALDAARTYGKDLIDNDFDVNGIMFVITDGLDNRSTNTPKQAKELIEKIRREETLGSFLSILIGVNIQDKYVKNGLATFEVEVGFDQYIELNNAKANTLAKLAKFVSRSISSQSQSLATGQPSQSLTF